MSYAVDYFNRRVLRDIESWPVEILADYARLIERHAQRRRAILRLHAEG